jgi:hypothetical protein
MPSSDDPALGATPLWTMATAELDTALDLLGVVDSTKRDKLRAAVTVEAGRYLRRTKQERATPPLSRQKEQLAKVKNAAGRLIEELEKLAPDAAFAFLYQLLRVGRDGGISSAADLATPMNIDDLRDFVALLRDGAAGASSFLDARSGPTSRPSLDLFVLSLCKLYEQITGKLATHNPYVKTEYKGEPQSAAGRFVKFIVRRVDPGLTPTQISTAMGHVVRRTLK